MSDTATTQKPDPFLARLHHGVSSLNGLRAWAFAATLGAIANLGFAPFHFWPLTAISIIGLVWLIDGARAQDKWGKALWMRGWSWGFGFFLVGMHWMTFPFLVEPEKHLAFIWMPLIAMPLGLGLLPAFASLTAGFAWTTNGARIFAFTVAFAAAELIRGSLFGGFPWNWVGTVWAPGGAISQLASLVGLFGLTLLTLFIFAAPAAFADTRSSASSASRIIPVALAVLLLAASWGWGMRRLSTPTQFTSESVRLVDAGVPQDEKWDPANAAKVLRKYLLLTSDDFESEPRIVIWPEGALPFFLFEEPNALDAIHQALGTRHLILGGVHRSERTPPVFNTLFVLDGTNAAQIQKAIYYKHRLVPFGELAAADIIPFGHRISGLLPPAMQRLATAGFSPGATPDTIDVPGIPTFLPVICYEALFPGLYQGLSSRPDMLVNVSIDSWFGNGIGPAQHFAQARYRSIETGIPMVRVASRGTTGVVDGRGQLTAKADRIVDENGWSQAVVDAQIPLSEENTIYSRNIDYLITLLLFLSCTGGWLILRR